MQKWQKLTVITLSLTALIVSCATSASYFLPPLNQRVLDIDVDAPQTKYVWYENVCTARKLGICWRHEDVKHVEHDFDFSKPEDRKTFYTQGWACSIRKRVDQKAERQ